jgi:hypothetical protein
VKATIVGVAPVFIGASTCVLWSRSSICFPDATQ